MSVTAGMESTTSLALLAENMEPTPEEQITELQAEIAELYGKLSRKGTRAGRPAICLCGHKRHAAQCQEPECLCAEYVADAKSGNAARKRKIDREIKAATEAWAKEKG